MAATTPHSNDFWQDEMAIFLTERYSLTEVFPDSGDSELGLPETLPPFCLGGVLKMSLRARSCCFATGDCAEDHHLLQQGAPTTREDAPATFATLAMAYP